jgi:sulfur carrier protein
VNVLVNGELKQLEPGATVQSALAALALEGGERGVAVAVDAEVVPRGEWPARELSEGARIEVLRAIQGG